MATLLFECFSEEMPAHMQTAAAIQLVDRMNKALSAAQMTHGTITSYVSPRHLAIAVSELPALQPDITTEKKGPRIDAPQAALDGFLKSTGLTSLDQCEQRTVGKDTVYFATITIKGRKVEDWLKETLEQILRDFSWPKSMRWGAHSLQWVRPLHRLTCLLDDKVIPVRFAHLEASNVTEGHRFMAPDPITLTHAESYVKTLRAAYVMVDAAERKAAIHTAAKKSAAAQQLSLVEDEGLLAEVTGLVEWPEIHIGTFDAHYMELPPEVLTSEMRHHQKYFALKNNSGALSNHFVITANMKTRDGGEAIKHGNARVLKARLADGEFYWQQDQQTPLSTWAEKLRDVVFHAKVGMMHEKVARIEHLALRIAEQVLPTADTALIRRAATLCKADLTTGMVGEFPELQGIMGRYYALEQGEEKSVAEAIYEHYKPQGAADSLPESDIGTLLSIADKLDSIISLFAAGEKPTGSKDPLALRRAALGVLRIIIDQEWNLDLIPLIRHSRVGGNLSNDQHTEIALFFSDRLRVILKDEGFRHDIISATIHEHENDAPSIVNSLNIQLKGLRPTEVAQTCSDLTAWLSTDEANTTLVAIKRALNILDAEEKKQNTSFDALSSLPPTLEKTEEKALWNHLQEIRTIPQHTLAALNPLAQAITNFFTASLVTEEGFREARLGLLALVREIVSQRADFSLIETGLQAR
jgi:glycyl-tRNA synthetase beta chain